MFGIRKGSAILCHTTVGMSFLSISHVKTPILFSVGLDADNFMQRISVSANDYALVVFQTTETEEYQYLLNRLQGY